MASRLILFIMSNVSDKSCRENQNTLFYVQKFLPKIVPFVRWCGKIRYSQTGHRKYTTPQARCVLVATTTNTHSEYVIRIPFPRQQWLCERALMLPYSTLPIFSLPWDQKSSQRLLHTFCLIFSTPFTTVRDFMQRFWWHKHKQWNAASSSARYGPVRSIFTSETS
jgi:hypothetical protein